MNLIAFPVLAAIIIIILILVFCIQNNRYKKTCYYAITRQPLLTMRGDKGLYGEYLIYRILQNNEKTGGKFLFNCYIPKGNDGTTEIDVILISCCGIYVFESKNYSGWIFGSESSKTWTQTLSQGKGKKALKEHFLNPIMQNKLHIKCLKNLIGFDIPVFSVIVFSERCTFKQMELMDPQIKVIKRDKVADIVYEHENVAQSILNEADIKKIYDILYPYTQVSATQKQEHIDRIKMNHK